MTHDEIIEMAREAGFSNEGLPFVDEWTVDDEVLQRFAALVEAKEREACAQVCESEWTNVAEKLFAADCAKMIRARGAK